jgi:tRNA-binding EMAP/Myf-like protein
LPASSFSASVPPSLCTRVADELLVGTVLEVTEHPGARAPSLLLTVDLGTYGRHDVDLPSAGYTSDALRGAQILCRRKDDGAIVAGAHSHAKGIVLLQPASDVEPGTLVS